MSRKLDVYLHHDLTGCLAQDDSGQMTFSYAESWLNNPRAIPLSHSLPLGPEHFRQKECAGFFGGILPEEDMRSRVARKLGISERNDFSMLEKIGGECAGAVTFMPAGEPLPQREDSYRDLSAKELAEVLETLPHRPLLAGEDGIRLSLAGAQDKLAVKVSGDTISIPMDGAPSTHILKPENPRFPGLIFNELFCLNLARAANLAAVRAEARKAGNKEYLLIERYDRKLIAAADGRESYQRLHQEDFCQALGIPSQSKYQAEGGPSLKSCFDLLRAVSALPATDLPRMLDGVIFNYLIGNHDAHGKNFSVIHHDDGSTRFARLYDLICTVYYPDLSPKMAMKIGGEYRSDLVTPGHFEKLAEEAGLSKPLVRERVGELAATLVEKIETVPQEHPVSKATADVVRKRCKGAADMFRQVSGVTGRGRGR